VTTRRQLLAIGASVLVAPTISRAQAKLYRVGFLSSEAPSETREIARLSTFRSALRDRGYVEGRNLVIETRVSKPRARQVPQPGIGDVVPPIAPKGDEPVVISFVDKFILGDKDTGLQKMLKDKGITTIVLVGTASHNGVLFTSVTASLRGFDVIVPVDEYREITAMRTSSQLTL